MGIYWIRGKDKNMKILAISSAGGHWVQLQRLRLAWQGNQAVYVTTKAEYQKDVLKDALDRSQPNHVFYTIEAATRWQKIKLLKQVFSIFRIYLRERPDVVISTGAAPGYFALRIGKLLGAKTIWVESIANADELSLSGQKVGTYADLWLTQWEHLAAESSDPKKPAFMGAVL